MDIQTVTIANGMDFLRQRSVEVDIENDKDLKDDIKKLEEYCLSHDVMAMAAVQIGVANRLIYLKNTNIELINLTSFNNAVIKENLELELYLK